MARRGDLNGWWLFGIAVVGFFSRVLFRLRVEGSDRVPSSGSAIVAGNHVSALDGVALALATGSRGRRMTRFLVAAEFFRKLWCGWALRLYRQIPIRRGGRDQGALDVAIETIRGGALAGIFPEGTVNPEPGAGLLRGRKGAARIALATDAPVVPVGIWGTQARWPKPGLHLRRPWRPVVAISYGEPIPPKGDAGSTADVQAFTDVITDAIAAQAERARKLAEA
ncbi:MAG TPA: lysophospholipid acyltransferase family protein [Actinomycetota bacterium]|nr:lysophospholipid acyltransferase family protein [Actinomycetota bacterium]